METAYTIGHPSKKGFPIYILRGEKSTLFGYWPTLDAARIELTKLVNCTR